MVENMKVNSETIKTGEILVEIFRNEIVESVHSGHLLILGADGRERLSLGSTKHAMYPRSAIKAIQASAMVRNGLKLEPNLLALVCSSHAGTSEHMDGALAILKSAGLDESALKNTPDKPLGEKERRAWGNSAPTSLAANCSGKHSGMVATCALNGWDISTYLTPNHELQIAYRKELEQLSGEKVSQVAVDGCGAPLFAISLTGLAKAIHALTVSKDPVHQEVVNACRNFPIMVSGEGRLPTLAMQKVPGLFCKDGAEGVIVLSLQDGQTLVWKISDGSFRGAAQLMAAGLARMGIQVEFEPEFIYGGGQVVGEIRASTLLHHG